MKQIELKSRQIYIGIPNFHAMSTPSYDKVGIVTKIGHTPHYWMSVKL